MSAALRLIDQTGGPESSVRALESGIQELLRPTVDADESTDRVRHLQDRFIENWARMAGAFAMDRTMGRVHALIYISPDPMHRVAIAHRLGMPVEICDTHIETLLAYGLIKMADQLADGTPRFVAEQDSWTWFLQTLRERRRREFQPLRQAVHEVWQIAKELESSSDRSSAHLRATVARVEAFAKFFEDLSKLLDAMVSLGAGPMVKVIKTVARLTPRWA